MSESDRALVVPTPRTVDRDNPWPGPEAFREGDEAFFFGRDRAIEEVSRLVTLNRLVILYGRSGLGKTSLLRAGVFPKVRGVAGLPIYVRLDFASGVPLRLQLKEAIDAVLARDHIEAPKVDPQATLWECFYRADMQFFNERSRRVRPVLVFDQFEEAFTHGASSERAAATRQFLDELIDLVRGNVPASVAKRLEENPELALTFSTGRDPCGVLLALRQEFIPELLRLRPRLPTLLDRRFELVAMTQADAEMVITRAGGELVDPGIATSIVTFVAGARRTAEDQTGDDATVDPAILSIFCRELNTKRKAAGMPRITRELVVGSQREIIADFYRGAVSDLPVGVRTFIEERLVTEPGYRDSVAVDDSLAASGLTKEVIDRLTDRRIVRINGTGSRARLELTHDVLTDPIAQIRKIRRVQEQEQRERDAALNAQRAEFEAQDRGRKERERQRELEAAQEKIAALNRQWNLAVAAVVLGIAFVSLAGWGFYRARREARESELRASAARTAISAAELLSQSQALRNSASSPLEASLLLGLESLKSLASPEAILQVSDTARMLPFPVARLEHSGEVRSITISRDERFAATVSGNTVHVWSTSSWQRVGQLSAGAEVKTAVFSPDSTKVVTLTVDRTAEIWDTAGTRLGTVPLRGSVNGLAFRDGRMLATASEDGAVVLWNVADPGTPREIGRAKHEAAVQALAFDGRGELLASSGDDVLRVWSVSSNGQLKKLRTLDRGQSVNSLLFVDGPGALAARLGWDDESRAVLASLDDFRSVLRVWNIPVKSATARSEAVKVPAETKLGSAGVAIARAFSGSAIQPAPALERISRRAAGKVSPLIMSGAGFLVLGERESGLWNVSEDARSAGPTANVSSSRETRELAMLGKSEALSGAVAENLGYIITGYGDGVALVWPLRDAPFSMLSANGKRAALRTELGWSEEPFQPPYVTVQWPSRRQPEPFRAALNSEGTMLAAADSRRFAIWQLEAPAKGSTPALDAVLTENEGPPLTVTLGANSLLVQRTKSVELYANNTGILTWSKALTGLAGAALARDEQHVATWGSDGTLNLWTVSQQAKPDEGRQELLATFRLGRVPSRVVFDRNGTTLAVCAGGRQVMLIDVATGKPGEPVALGAGCRSFAFAAAGKDLVIGTDSGDVSIVDYPSGNIRTSFRLDAEVLSVAFSPSAAFVAGASADGIVHVWRTADASEISRFALSARTETEAQLMFSSDERAIFMNGSLARWQSADVIEEGCLHVTRNLSDDERDRYGCRKR